ncbi:MAG: biopolymer transporter ExbD [Cyanobacteria bacterium P01_D01_bin.73]
MKINLDSPGEDVRIEILPLIDVIFCILTFFILAAVTLTRQEAIEVDLPEASTSAPQTKSNVVIALSPSGQLYWDGEAIAVEQLLRDLPTFLRSNPSGKIIFYASRSAFYSDVINTLDLLRSVGGSRVALATQRPQSDIPGADFDNPNFEDSNSDAPENPAGDRIPSTPSTGVPFPGQPDGTLPGLPDDRPAGNDPFNRNRRSPLGTPDSNRRSFP